jgi:baseplate J-like protein
MHETFVDHMQHIVASMDNEQCNQEQETPGTSEQETEPAETIHIHYFPDAIVIVKEDGDTAQQDNTVETTLAHTKKPPVLIAYAICLGYLFLIFSCITFQVYCVFNPPGATIRILTTQTPITTHTTVTLPAHQLTPLVFSQTQTINTTGRGHQPATQARGYVTFYNSLTQPQTIDAGTLLVGADNEQVVTNEPAYIPAGNLSTNGHATVSAHAVNYGSEGNIRAGDIYGACCRAFIQVVNSAFSGGRNERDFQAVAKADIDKVVNTLTSLFQQTLQNYVLSHLSSDETLLTPIPCTTTIQSNYPIGAEAALVTVTFQKTCSPLSYNTSDLQQQAVNILTQEAQNYLGSDYTLQGNIATSITKTAIRQQSILLSVSCSGSWARAFNTRYLATLIAGKTADQAITILQQAQGVKNTGIHLEGFTDRIPKNLDRIHFVFLYEIA